MTIAELLDLLGRTAPWSKAADWDPVGLQLGDGGGAVTSVAVCHEVTDDVVTRVLASPPSLLLTYHPLLFRPKVGLIAGPGPEGRAFRLLAAGVAVAAAHTNFDAAPGGTSEALAQALGLETLRPFGPARTAPTIKVVTFVPESQVAVLRDALADAGAGIIGNYTRCSFRVEGVGSFFAGSGTSPTIGEAASLNEEPEIRLEMVAPREQAAAVVTALVSSHPYEEPAFDVYELEPMAIFGRLGTLSEPLTPAGLAALVADRLDVDAVRIAGRDAAIREVAVLPGSGSDYIESARSAGAQALVTGDVSHHAAVGAVDRGLTLVDPGHAATERPGVRRLAAVLAGLVPEMRDLTDLTPDPWTWGP